MTSMETDMSESESRGRALVLLVEDDADLASLLISSLMDLPVDIQHVSARGAAVELLDKVRPSLMLLDLGLPDGDGSRVVEQLRVAGLESMPLVVYTVRDLDSLEKARLKLGETHYLTKSRASLEDVVSLVSDMIKRGVVGGQT